MKEQLVWRYMSEQEADRWVRIEATCRKISTACQLIAAQNSASDLSRDDQRVIGHDLIVLAGELTQLGVALCLGSDTASPNAGRLGGPCWSRPMLCLGGRSDGDGGLRWPAGLAALSMVGPLDREIAHLSLDHTWATSTPALWIELINHFGKQQQIMIAIMIEGENAPVSRRGTG